MPRWPNISAEERFWLKVRKTKTSCWFWCGSKDSSGYGTFWYEGKIQSSHRVVWQLTRGIIPSKIRVLHNCPGGDNPSCVNPKHLWLGTQRDNMRDMICKGRGNKVAGECCHLSKLTKRTVAKIRSDYATSNFTQTVLARRYSVTQGLISQIVLNKIWHGVAV